MKWKTFFQIAVLLLIAGTIFYFVYPKYQFLMKGVIRGNKITGEVMMYQRGGNGGVTVGGKWKKF